MNEELISTLSKIIHDGLGGDGWAYSNYGSNELVDCIEMLNNASRSVLEFLDGNGYLVDEFPDRMPH